MNYEYAEECLKKADEKKEGFFPDVNGIEMNTEAGIMVDTRGMALEDSYSPTRHIEWPEPKDPFGFSIWGCRIWINQISRL
ncbi:MAG: hypothetical protein IPO72_18775 [Saprospiraceae bacterium]|nr:hypothetical protein [Candidatus Vicinibacter affinis]